MIVWMIFGLLILICDELRRIRKALERKGEC